MKLKLVAILSVFYAVAGFSQQPNDVEIKDFKYSGTGCSSGTAKAIVVPYAFGEAQVSYFQVTFGKFLAERGPGKSPRDSNKYCTLAISVDYEPGYQFTMDTMEFDGFGEIAEGTTGSFEVAYKLSNPNKEAKEKTYKGPWEGDWSDGSSRMDFKNVYSNCRGSDILRVDTSIILRKSREGISQMGIDVASGKLKQKMRLKWRKCN